MMKILEYKLTIQIVPFWKDTLSSPNLTDSMRETCEGLLTYSECFKVLSTFNNDKTPRNDGLTIEFYKFFWSEIGTFLVDSLNYSYFHGELSNLQKQAVITLIEKKDKTGDGQKTGDQFLW